MSEERLAEIIMNWYENVSDESLEIIDELLEEEVQPLKCNPIESNQSIMTTVKETDRAFIKAYTDDYAKAITENYRLYHIDSMERMLSANPESTYAAQELNDVQTGKANLMKFVVKTGKKYYKIVQQEFETWEKSKYYGQYRDGSVHAFVDKETGEVYKPAGWAKPAKHVRFDMRDERQLKFLLDPKNVDWAGGYLYLR